MRRTLLALALTMAPQVACKQTVPPGGSSNATAMGSWQEWRDLTPLVELAEHHAPPTAVKAMVAAQGLLREGKAKSADGVLSEAADGAGQAWISVARADLAALHFTLCIRGIAWRLQDGKDPSPTDRSVDFSEGTRIEPGDVSVEATLTNLDIPLASEVPALVTQARIARARVAAFASQCAANDDVAGMAQRTVEADLATLAAEGHLTPDLAYLWAGVQMTKFSPSAARPFLVQARDGGFDHPAAIFMLAVIALEERELDRAEGLAHEAISAYRSIQDDAHVAEGDYLLGEIARARKQPKAARKHYESALRLYPMHAPSILALASLAHVSEGADAGAAVIHAALPKLLLTGTLDEEKARTAADNLADLLTLAVEPAQVQLVRDALLDRIDNEPDAMRRGLRYFFAATLDVRLREYEVAHGHGVLAKEEFTSSSVQPPVDIEKFLDHLTAG
jgi:tetratricopeptide (TPR) repeat protein